MDGGPVLSVGREGLPTLQVNRIRGIFNSTTNYILTRMEEDGLTFDEALRKAQEIGIAETDPTLDIDGWDAAIKTVIVANVIMGADLRPADVNREGFVGWRWRKSGGGGRRAAHPPDVHGRADGHRRGAGDRQARARAHRQCLRVSRARQASWSSRRTCCRVTILERPRPADHGLRHACRHDQPGAWPPPRRRGAAVGVIAVMLSRWKYWHGVLWANLPLPTGGPSGRLPC